MKNKNHKQTLRISVIAYPVWKSLTTPLSNVMEILCSFSDSIYLIKGSGILIANSKTIRNRLSEMDEPYQKNTRNLLAKIIEYALLQIRISFYFMKLSRKIDICFLFMEDSAPLVMLLAKILRKRILWDVISNVSEPIQYSNKKVRRSLAFYLKGTMRYMADNLILASPNLIKQWHLEKYQNKICLSYEHFFDFNQYVVKNNLKERQISIAYIGRFSEEKGTLNFVKAIPNILRLENDISILIGGDGPLREEIDKYLKDQDLRGKVEICGWIRHEEMVDRLNKIKILVIPSYTEGGPLIALEAMACGAVVLASRVGMIPDIIQDGVTGFLLENNSNECISKNILRVLKCANLQQVATNGRLLIENEFTFEKTALKYKRILLDEFGG